MEGLLHIHRSKPWIEILFFLLVVGLIVDVNLRYGGLTVFIENNLHVCGFVQFKSVLFKGQFCSISVTTLVIIVAATLDRIIF